MNADRKYRLWKICRPANAFRQRDVRPRIHMPGLALTPRVGRIAPSGIGDHVTILSKQRFDDFEDLTVCNTPSSGFRAIQQLVPKMLIEFCGARCTPICRPLVEHFVYRSAELRHSLLV
jgi:hypothetical protein